MAIKPVKPVKPATPFTNTPSHMRAFVASRFGPPRTVLSLENHKPTPPPPAANAVQIRVHYAGVHGGDWRLVRGDPWLIRLIFGRVSVPGCELSGVVTAVGQGVSRVRPGDRVLADASESGFAAFSDVVTVSAAHVARVSDKVAFRDAAATVVSALAALQAFDAAGGVTSDDRVLVSGASGGVGHFVVQIARQAGAHVTAVCRDRKAAAVRQLGANEVVSADELRAAAAGKGDGGERRGDAEKPYTVVIDVACYEAPCDVIGNLMRRGGRYVLVGGNTGLLLRTAVLAGVMKWRLGVKVSVLTSRPNADDLDRVVGMLERGEIAPLVERTFKFEETIDALEFVEDRKVTGKVVIDFECDDLSFKDQ